jgi:hypothetical protein
MVMNVPRPAGGDPTHFVKQKKRVPKMLRNAAHITHCLYPFTFPLLGEFTPMVTLLCEGLREATGRGGVNGSKIKFFCRNRPMSQVQIPRPKPYKKVMNTPTNNVEMISSML